MSLPTLLHLAAIRSLYAQGRITPHSLVETLSARIEAADPAVFVTRATLADMHAQADALVARAPTPNSLPLWAMPFAVKDNIDVAGFPTTAACPAFAHDVVADAEVVARLRAAGAIMIGKTNLDQFATGLNGTRSPYGAPRSVFDADYISGGSSSGSAVAVAAGLAAFSLGTDTAGSGRVPAAFNNIVGIKPTPGLLSSSGVVPACRSLDCISVFALTVADGAEVRRIAEGFDTADPYSRHAKPGALPQRGLRVGVLKPADREFFGDREAARLYDEAIARLGETVVEIDFAPFRETAALLYNGPWVAERTAAFESFRVPLDAVDPSVAAITMGGAGMSAIDVFRGQYELEALKRRAEGEWAKVDILLLPTAPTTYRVDQMLADPITLWSIGGSILAPLFEGGRLTAQAEAAGAQRDQAAFAYRRAALTAFREVEDALASAKRLDEQVGLARAQQDALAEGLRLATNRYREGYSPYLEQLDAQRGLLGAQLSLIQLRADALTARVQLFQAMGGGWQRCPTAGDTCVPEIAGY